jgi:hypothetical protein
MALVIGARTAALSRPDEQAGRAGRQRHVALHPHGAIKANHLDVAWFRLFQQRQILLRQALADRAGYLRHAGEHDAVPVGEGDGGPGR